MELRDSARERPHPPDVTVLMTVYNGMPYLRQAIESILEQTWADFEFLVVNDCSTDDSRDVILSYDDPRIRLLDNEENINQTRSLNRGLESVRSELIARMDADDISHPKRLEMQVAYLEEHPDVVAVGTGLRFITHTGRVTGRLVRPEHDLALRWLQLFDCPLSCGAVMFRRSTVWGTFGGFDPSIRLYQDWELWSRVLPEYKIANLPEVLLDVRKHSGCETVVFRDIALGEGKRITSANLRNILGIRDHSEEWLAKVDALTAERATHPEHLLQVVQMLFERFCELYPEAREDDQILSELSKQYLRVLSHAGLRHVPLVFRAVRLAWPMSSKMLFMSRLVRCLAVRMGARHVKRWLSRLGIC